jgi:hypothetical protein
MTESRAEIEARIRNQVRSNFKKESPENGTYKFVVTSTSKLDQPSKGDKDGNGAGCPTVAMRVAPIDAEGVPQAQYETTVWLTLPTINTAIEGHTVDSTTLSKFTATMSAVAPERVPYVPAKNPDGTWDNTPGTKAARQNAQVEASVLAYEILEGTFKLEDREFYANTKKAEGKDGYYLNSLRSELKPGETLTNGSN